MQEQINELIQKYLFRENPTCDALKSMHKRVVVHNLKDAATIEEVERTVKPN